MLRKAPSRYPEGVSFLAQVVVNAIALFLLDRLMDGVAVFSSAEELAILKQQAAGVLGASGNVVTPLVVYLVVGLVLALVNTVVKPVVKVLALPLYLLSLGLFGLVINALMLLLVSKLAGFLGVGLYIASFGTAVWAGLTLSILTALVSIPFKTKSDQ
jgi:putative membrane protein